MVRGHISVQHMLMPRRNGHDSRFHGIRIRMWRLSVCRLVHYLCLPRRRRILADFNDPHVIIRVPIPRRIRSTTRRAWQPPFSSFFEFRLRRGGAITLTIGQDFPDRGIPASSGRGPRACHRRTHVCDLDLGQESEPPEGSAGGHHSRRNPDRLRVDGIA